MTIAEIIAQKQAGDELTSQTISRVVREYAEGIIPDYQMAALLMAIYFQGMTRRETVDLVREMVASGKSADHRGLDKIKVDKHSTGGVGDKTSLIIAPIVASCGVPVPMISGRGLGHTGGTLDKLESIPGFTTALSLQEFEHQVAEIGCGLIGQTDEIVPADRKMYALRDVTSTVRSVPLICGSILSKKIAEGSDALVLDVKFGRGAVFSDLDGARNLARNLVDIGDASGLKVQALLTDMDQPLGNAVGNWLEVCECLDIMRGTGGGNDLKELSIVESALMLVMSGTAADFDEGRKLAEDSLASGRALDKFIEIARRQQADVSFLEEPDKYRTAEANYTLESAEDGYIHDIDALAVGLATVDLGGGRQQKEDDIDYTAGFLFHRKRGEAVSRGEPVVTIYAGSVDLIDAILPDIKGAIKMGPEKPAGRPLIRSLITAEGEAEWQ